MFGSFGVLMPAVEVRLGVNRDLSSLGMPCVLLGMALMSPVAGALASKISLRLLMLTGAMMNLVTYLILAQSHSIGLNLLAYGFLAGPGQALGAIILPSMLVTRWYNVNRGRALGLITMPIVPVVLPLLTSVVLRHFDLWVAYYMLAALVALVIVPMLLVIDYPPGAIRADIKDRRIHDAAAPAAPAMSVGNFLASGRFWALSLAAAAVVSTSIVFSAHLVSIARSWGIEPTRSAGLLSIASLAGMAGSVGFGWLADHLGGARTLALLCLNSALLWLIMVFQPPFLVLAAIVALMGLHGAALIPTFGVALSQQFGRSGFGRGLGVFYLMSLPFNLMAVPIAAHVYVRTGSYLDALIGIVAFLLLATVLASTITRPSLSAAAL